MYLGVYSFGFQAWARCSGLRVLWLRNFGLYGFNILHIAGFRGFGCSWLRSGSRIACSGFWINLDLDLKQEKIHTKEIKFRSLV